MYRFLSISLFAFAFPLTAWAHASEGGFVLLLPTTAYMVAGVLTVAATVLLVSFLPGKTTLSLFSQREIRRSRTFRGHQIAGFLGFTILIGLFAIGLLGPHDPRKNLLPLTVWWAFWVGLPVLHAIFGNLWHHFNPWHWPAFICRRLGLYPKMRLPAGAGHMIALASFLAFALVLLAHPAPTDPETLAQMLACYWAFHFIGTLIFGPKWLKRAEGFGQLFAAYATLSPLTRQGGAWKLGLPGWQLLRRSPALGVALFYIVLLAVGSFDGLNETFLWIDMIGLNPLEYEGRSAAIEPNIIGLVLAVPALIAAFALTVKAGLILIRKKGIAQPFRSLAPAMLPIAFGYHIAHYLPSSLIDAQYFVLALNDPLLSGLNLLGLDHRHVTAGFFSNLSSQRLIWLTQASVIVFGHVLAVLLGHALALRHFKNQRDAALSQIPLALFMIAYTLLGLWLLATPRGA